MRFEVGAGQIRLRLGCSIFLLAACAISQAWADAKNIKVYRDEYLIEAPQGVAAASSSGVKALGFSVVREVGSAGIKLIKPSLRAARSSAADGHAAVAYDPKTSLCPLLLKRGLAKQCSPNFQLHTLATSNDPQLSSLWGMGEQGLNALGAWDISTGSSDIVVAIIDTGVDYTHPDLAQNIWSNPGEIPGNGVDDDANGYIDDIHGINAITRSSDPMDDNSHGTHVAGTIGAVGNNALGVAGVNWQVKIMGLKFLNRDGAGSLSDAIDAIDYMVAMKHRGVNIRVANNSWGGGGYSSLLEGAIVRARDAGIIFAAAAGNESNDNDASPSYPASYEVDNIVAVAAIDNARNLASFSNYGALSVGIAAPGVGILSTTPGNRYASYSGTSMATPHVSGALALLFASEPALSYTQAITRLYESGIELPALAGIVSTARKVSAARMLANQTLPLPVRPQPSVCQYGVEEIGYAPDYSADAAPIVIQADEASFHKVSLPFDFPFHGTPVNTVYLSPNGVAYMNRAPSALDYRNEASAPRNAIAALHADLIAEYDPYGVRVVTLADRAVVLWKMRHFSQRNSGDLEARLILYSDGRIEDYLAFSTPEAEVLAQYGSTLGLSGPTSDSAITFAYATSAIRNHLGVRYTPYCDGGDGGNASVQSVKIHGLRHNRLRANLAPGRRLQISVGGSGDGAVAIRAAFNRRSCPAPRFTRLAAGALTLRGVLPKVPTSVTRLTVMVAQAKGNARVVTHSIGSVKKVREISAARFNRYCEQLMNSLTQ